MFGSSKSCLLAAAAACIASTPFAAIAVAQPGGAVPPGRAVVANASNQPQGGQAEIDPVLLQLLEHWAKTSRDIRTLEGSHLRRVYDFTFEVERVSHGRFFYESPDKGRIDVEPIQITPQMIKDREEGKMPCRRGRSGKPFELEGDLSEKWICDGEKIFEIDEEKKEAVVAQLPPQLQGVNIMNSPLPFLFGLPPNEAVQRFSLSFSPDQNGEPRVFKRGDTVAHIRAEPRLMQDQQNWSRADIILDVRTFLPTDVRLINPAGTEQTVYQFREMKKNPLNFGALVGKDWFRPNLRPYNVTVMQPGQGQGQGQANATQKPQASVVPDLKGLPYTEAVEQLESLGLSKEDISLHKGGAAANAADVYHVRNQNPAPGAPLKPGLKVALQVWDKQAL